MHGKLVFFELAIFKNKFIPLRKFSKYKNIVPNMMHTTNELLQAREKYDSYDTSCWTNACK